jgi:hypothetical protein
MSSICTTNDASEKSWADAELSFMSVRRPDQIVANFDPQIISAASNSAGFIFNAIAASRCDIAGSSIER